ncbi:MAG: xylulokinase [Sporolactobacillus sp.]|jgi:xylulokinase|nr:xylulokinase [Sporolactobacillus sp.]
MDCVLGLDLGTSSLKGVLYTFQGNVIASDSVPYDVIQPKDGYCEQNPLDWLRAVDRLFDALMSRIPSTIHLKGIAVSGQMHSLVTLDHKNRVVRHAILWNDSRTTAQVKQINREFGVELRSISKNRPLEGFTLPKILWMQQEEPEQWNRVAHIMLPKDFLNWYLTGHIYTDYSDAAGTLLLDEERHCWSKEIGEKLSIQPQQLPEIKLSGTQIGILRSELAQQYNINEPVKIFQGGADNACAALGSGITDLHTALSSIGTSGVYLANDVRARNNVESTMHVFNHVIKNRYYKMGVTLSAGSSLTWFQRAFYPDTSISELVTGIEKVPIGANGLIFTPYLNGERTPLFDADIRGALIGVDSCQNKLSVVRSIIEGITLSLKDSQQMIENEASPQIKEVICVGGGARNRTWLQMQADVFNHPVRRLVSGEGPSLGAAILATYGLGIYDSLPACVRHFVKYDEPIRPIPNNVEQYRRLFSVYKQVYGQTKHLSDRLQPFRR